MHIDWWTLGLQAVNALVLIWLLAHFLYRPVVNAIAARQKAAGQLLTDAQAAKAAAEAERQKAAAETAGLVEHRSEAQAAEERAAQLAVDIAAKLLDRLPEEARVAAFIDGVATGLAKLPDGTRASLGAGGAAIRLTFARAATPEEVEAWRQDLAKVLGHPVLVEVSVDPELIAGIELEAPHAVVRNSFRADLVRLKSELVHHATDAA